MSTNTLHCAGAVFLSALLQKEGMLNDDGKFFIAAEE
jgi:hypothetical protein